MKNLFVICSLFIYLAGLSYLTQPDPALPELSDAIRSDEPGDTWQHPDQSAYYTNRDSRPGILGELQRGFSLTTPLGRFFEYRLNYRPEEVGELVRDQLKSYYLEEVVHPLRESLFINVLDPEKSPMIDDKQRQQQRMYFKNVFYPIKVTLRPIYSSPSGRVIVWTLIFPAIYFIALSLKKSFYEV